MFFLFSELDWNEEGHVRDFDVHSKVISSKVGSISDSTQTFHRRPSFGPESGCETGN